MNAPSVFIAPLPSRHAAPETIALLAGIAAAALGIAVLVGWALDSAVLKSVMPGLITMKANTAAGMILCGIALALLSRSNATHAVLFPVRAIALMVIMLAGVSLVEDLFGWNAGIDQLLFSDTTDALEATSPGRIPPSATFCLLLLGSSLLVATLRMPSWVQVPVLYGLATAVVVIGGLGLIGHVSALLWGSRWWDYAGMAFHSTFGFLLLGCGVLALVRRGHRLDWSLNRFITGGFAIGILSLVAATALSYSFTSELHRESVRVNRSQEVLEELDEVESGVDSLQGSQRGYVITGDERLLDGRREVADAVREHLPRARKLAADDPAQQRRIDRLAPLLSQRREFEDRTIDARRARGFADAQRMISSGEGIELSRRIDALLREIKDAENAILDVRHKRSDATATANFLLLPLGVFLSLTILLTGLFLLNSAAQAQKRTEEAKRASEAKYRQLIEQASDGICMLDAMSRIRFANPRACELLGYREKDLCSASTARSPTQNRSAMFPASAGGRRKSARSCATSAW